MSRSQNRNINTEQTERQTELIPSKPESVDSIHDKGINDKDRNDEQTRAKTGWFLPVSVIIWATLTLAGVFIMTTYAGTPGSSGHASPIYPQANTDAKPTPKLLIFLHPHCSCSESTIRGLERIIARSQSDQMIQFVFVQPKGTSKAWVQSNLWKTAQNFPNRQLTIDQDGKLATLFGVQTSGHALFYDEQGKLRFSGGLTSARAHEGPSLGQQCLLALLNNRNPDCETSYVFGCSLLTPESR